MGKELVVLGRPVPLGGSSSATETQVVTSYRRTGRAPCR